MEKFLGKLHNGIYHYSTAMEEPCKELSAEEHIAYKAYFQGHIFEIFTQSCDFTRRSGPSPVIQRFLKKEESHLLDVTFLDHDFESVEYLQNRLRNLQDLYQRKTHFRFINLNVKDAFMDSEIIASLAGQDFIFCSGLFDYLDDEQAVLLASILYSLLASGGVLLIGNLCSESKGKIFQWYINDWPIFFRTREQLLSIIPDGTKAEVQTDKSGYNLFLKIVKI